MPSFYLSFIETLVSVVNYALDFIKLLPLFIVLSLNFGIME